MDKGEQMREKSIDLLELNNLLPRFTELSYLLFVQEDRSAGRKGSLRRSPTSARPTKTLFVINFDPINTRIRDLERHFDKYGRVANVRIKKNFAFVQFEVQEDATRALEGTNGR